MALLFRLCQVNSICNGAQAMSRLCENDELASEKQGSKLIMALLSVVTSEYDFSGDAARQFKENRAACKKMLVYLVETNMARFPSQGQDDRRDKDDDDDEDTRLEAEVKAAFELDEEIAADSSFQPRENAEAKVEGDAVLDLTVEEERCIAQFTCIAMRVVQRFAKTVCEQFPRVTEMVA